MALSQAEAKPQTCIQLFTGEKPESDTSEMLAQIRNEYLHLDEKAGLQSYWKKLHEIQRSHGHNGMLPVLRHFLLDSRTPDWIFSATVNFARVALARHPSDANLLDLVIQSVQLQGFKLKQPSELTNLLEYILKKTGDHQSRRTLHLEILARDLARTMQGQGSRSPTKDQLAAREFFSSANSRLTREWSPLEEKLLLKKMTEADADSAQRHFLSIKEQSASVTLPLSNKMEMEAEVTIQLPASVSIARKDSSTNPVKVDDIKTAASLLLDLFVESEKHATVRPTVFPIDYPLSLKPLGSRTEHVHSHRDLHLSNSGAADVRAFVAEIPNVLPFFHYISIGENNSYSYKYFVTHQFEQVTKLDSKDRHLERAGYLLRERSFRSQNGLSNGGSVLFLTKLKVESDGFMQTNREYQVYLPENVSKELKESAITELLAREGLSGGNVGEVSSLRRERYGMNLHWRGVKIGFVIVEAFSDGAYRFKLEIEPQWKDLYSLRRETFQEFTRKLGGLLNGRL